MSNIKQIQLGLIMYASDNDGKVVPASVGGGGAPFWEGSLYPYVKNAQIFVCPADPGFGLEAAAIGGEYWSQTTPPGASSYAINCSYSGGYIPAATPIDVSIQYPAEMLGITDAVGGPWTAATWLSSNNTLATDLGLMCTGGLATNCWHNGGVNQSHVDGHVKWIALNAIPDPAGGAEPAGSPAKHYWQGID